MGLRGNFGWSFDQEVYSEPQVEAVLRQAGIDLISETERDFLCYCPYHYNTGSPAFSVSKSTGQFICFNPSCGKKGGLSQLLKEVGNMSDFQAKMSIEKAKTNIDYVSLIDRASQEFEFVEYSEDKLFEYNAALPNSPGLEYMYGRGFNKETLDHFDIGYFEETDEDAGTVDGFISVPMHSDTGMCLGYIGRSIEGKEFKNSPRLPKRMTSYNIHRAKRAGATVIVCEASFDAMRIHQAGFPNVIALLGGSNLNRAIIEQLQHYFTTIIIMTDNDEAGRAMGKKIEEKVKRRVLWAVHGDGIVFPNGSKDAGDMTDSEIGKCLRGAVSGLEYQEFYGTIE